MKKLIIILALLWPLCTWAGGMNPYIAGIEAANPFTGFTDNFDDVSDNNPPTTAKWSDRYAWNNSKINAGAYLKVDADTTSLIGSIYATEIAAVAYGYLTKSALSNQANRYFQVTVNGSLPSHQGWPEIVLYNSGNESDITAGTWKNCMRIIFQAGTYNKVTVYDYTADGTEANVVSPTSATYGSGDTLKVEMNSTSTFSVYVGGSKIVDAVTTNATMGTSIKGAIRFCTNGTTERTISFSEAQWQ